MMSRLLATARRSPASLVGTLVALTGAAAIVTVVASIIGTAGSAQPAVQRLAGSPVVLVGNQHVRITTGRGDNRETTSYALSTQRRVPVTLADGLRALPGVSAVVADVSIPITLLPASHPAGRAEDATAHGWASAAINPLRLVAGNAPAGPQQVVLTAGLARTLHIGVGHPLRLSGRDLPAFRVSGLVAGPPGRRPAPAAYLTQVETAKLYRHPGQADLLAVLPTPRARTDTGRLAAEVRAVAGDRYQVLTGDQRGLAEHVGAAGDADNIIVFGWAAGMPVVMISLFVVAGAVGLSIAGRRRYFALLRAVGATPGQVRRAVIGELAVLGVLGGLLGYPIGTFIGRLAVAGMVRHDLLPAATHFWSAWWVLLIACGAGLVVAELAGFAAGWRAARTQPVLALSEATVDRRRTNPLRLLLGVAAAAGGVTLSIVAFQQAQTPTDELNFALLTLLAFVAAVGLLGPALVQAAEPLLRLPVRLLGGTAARLALADISRRPRRIASAVVAVGLSVGFLGTVYLVNATVVNADHTQTVSRLAADGVVTAPGGLAPAAVPTLAGLPGVHAAVGVTSTSAYTTLNGGDAVAAAALTPGPIPAVLHLGVVAGSLDRITSGQVALSQLEAGRQRIGSTVLIYLADGTPYRARVSAIYTHGIGFGDVLIPDDAAGGGHLGTTTVDQILLRGRLPAREVTALAARFPGLTVHSRAAANAQAQRLDDQSLYLNTLLVILIAMLAAVTVVNTMATATVEQREALHLLDRVGATRRQLLGMACWQVVTVALIGMLAGVAAGGSALIAVTRALTGSWHPYIPIGPVVSLGAAILALTAAAVLGPTAAILRVTRHGV